MNAASRPYPIVQDLIESFAGWLKHRRELSELRQLDRSDFGRSRMISGSRPMIWKSWSTTAGTRPTNSRKCWSSLASTPTACSARSRSCCATWSGSARCAIKRHAAIWSSSPARSLKITTAIAAMPRRWSHSIAPTSRRAELQRAAVGLIRRRPRRETTLLDARRTVARRGAGARSRRCCATSSGSARSAITRDSATTISPAASPRRTITAVARGSNSMTYAGSRFSGEAAGQVSAIVRA
ncbi:hypothetical protein V1280_005981 [Bradyrhizobium sp. AZCC 2230]